MKEEVPAPKPKKAAAEVKTPKKAAKKAPEAVSEPVKKAPKKAAKKAPAKADSRAAAKKAAVKSAAFDDADEDDEEDDGFEVQSSWPLMKSFLACIHISGHHDSLSYVQPTCPGLESYQKCDTSNQQSSCLLASANRCQA